MEIGVRVETENLINSEIRHTNSAYFTYVLLDKAGRPREVPTLFLETQDEKRRNREAIVRRDTRLKLKEMEKLKLI
jgi:acyl-CoA hydrolase